MFGKINRDYIKHNLNKAKSFIGHNYAQGKRMAHHIDHGFNIAKKVYGAVAPVLDSLAGNENFTKINKHVSKAVSGYDAIRQNVIDGHEQAEKHYNSIKSNLKKNNVSIGL